MVLDVRQFIKQKSEVAPVAPVIPDVFSKNPYSKFRNALPKTETFTDQPISPNEIKKEKTREIIQSFPKKEPTSFGITEQPDMTKPPRKGTFFQRVGEYVSPKPKTRVVDFVREFGASLEKVGSFIKSVQEHVARYGASAALTITGDAKEETIGMGGKGSEMVLTREKGDTIQQRIEKGAMRLFFGDKPLQSINARVVAAEKSVKDFGEKAQKSEKEWQRSLGKYSEENAFGLSVFGVFGGAVLDFTGGGGKESVIKQITKSKNVPFISKMLRQMGVAEDIIPATAKKMATISDEKIIAQAINKIDDLQKSTKVIKQGIEEAVGTQKNTLNLEKKAKILAGQKAEFKEAIKDKVPKTISKELEPAVKKINEIKTDNVKKFVKGKQRERGFVTNVKKNLPKVKAKGSSTKRSTVELAIKAKNLVKDNVVKAEKIALEASDDEGVAIASELIKHFEKTKQYDKAAEITNEVARRLTESGRMSQAASIIGMNTPEGQMRFAAREIQKYNEGIEAAKKSLRKPLAGLRKKIPELTGEQAKNILDKMKKIKEMPDGVEKIKAFRKLQDEISSLIPSPWYKKLINIRKAGMLTGPTTSFLNIIATLSHGTSELVSEIPAVVFDSVASIWTKERTRALTTKGLIGGFKEGWKKGIRYMKTGFDERDIAVKLDWRKVNYGRVVNGKVVKGKVAKSLEKYEETIFHLMGAEDQPVYYAIKTNSIMSQAIAQGKNSKLKGKELQKFVDNLLQNPTDKMIKYAINDAEIAIFTNKTVIGDAARYVQKIGDGAGEMVVPFGRTPSAVANQLINYSPLGYVKALAQNIGKGRFDQRLFSKTMGRATVGTGAMYLGTKLYDKDLISLSYPKTERERKQWELEGRKAFSFKTPDGKWRSVAVLGPVGFSLVVGGYYQRAMNETGSHSGAIIEAHFGGAKSLTEQTFLRDLNSFTKAIMEPEDKALKFISNTFASFIPSIISGVARTGDELERRTNPKKEGFFAPAQSRIPGAREKLEPRIDVMGRPVVMAGNAIETMIDPSRPSRIKSNSIIEELRRLANAGYIATPTGFADEKSYMEILTPEQITYLQEKAGLMLEDKLEILFTLSEYKKLTDDEKKKKIQDFTNKARLNSRAEMVENLTMDLSGEELKNKLGELKEAKFMTKSVFEKWQELFGIFK